MIHFLNGADTILNKAIIWMDINHKATHTVQIHTHTHARRDDIADEVLVSKLHHSVGGYKETIPSHHSSFASLYRAPPSNPPHNLLLQLELASNAHLLSLRLAVMDFCLTKHAFLNPSFCLPIPFSSFLLGICSSTLIIQ